MEMIPREPTVPEAKTKTETKKQEFRRRVREMMFKKECAKYYQQFMTARDREMRSLRNKLLGAGYVDIALEVDNIIKAKINKTNQK